MKRTADVREHHRQRVIRRRLDILHNVWQTDIAYWNLDTDTEIHYSEQPNRLDKWNLTCDCWHHKLINDEHERMLRHRLDVRANVEFNDWVNDVDDGLCESIYNEVMYE